VRGGELPVTVNKTISCSLGGKKRLININVTSEVQSPSFKKDGNNISYLLPTNFAVIENGRDYIKK
jgi:hypothetical protein